MGAPTEDSRDVRGTHYARQPWATLADEIMASRPVPPPLPSARVLSWPEEPPVLYRIAQPVQKKWLTDEELVAELKRLDQNPW